MDITKNKLNCMEVRGGFHAANDFYSTAGLNIWLYSQPHEQDTSGGDVYSLSSCASGRISRILLADISGHGKKIEHVSQRLQGLMRKSINHKNTTNLITQLNQDFSNDDDEEFFFATGLVATYFAPEKKFTLNCAGHPPPIHYSQKQNSWKPLLCTQESDPVPLTNLPLGVTDETRYSMYEATLDEGDGILLFTDGLIEAEDQTGNVLGTQGLLTLLNELQFPGGTKFLPQLLEEVHQCTGDSLQRDDLTLIFCQTKKSEVNLLSNLLAPYHLVRSLLKS